MATGLGSTGTERKEDLVLLDEPLDGSEDGVGVGDVGAVLVGAVGQVDGEDDAAVAARGERAERGVPFGESRGATLEVDLKGEVDVEIDDHQRRLGRRERGCGDNQISSHGASS
jgi:hypothetical protein